MTVSDFNEKYLKEIIDINKKHKSVSVKLFQKHTFNITENQD